MDMLFCKIEVSCHIHYVPILIEVNTEGDGGRERERENERMGEKLRYAVKVPSRGVPANVYTQK